MVRSGSTEGRSDPGVRAPAGDAGDDARRHRADGAAGDEGAAGVERHDPAAPPADLAAADAAEGGAGRAPLSDRLPALVVFVVALAVGAGVRVWQLGGRVALIWNDTIDFLASSRAGWDSPALWAGARAPGVPMALKVLGGDGERYVDLQAGIAAVCWAALCASVATVVAGRWPRVVAVTAVLAFSLTTPVTMWDRSILSESPGTSSLALVVAAGVQVARGTTWRRLGLLVAALVPWLALRDTHAVVALAGGAAALAAAAGAELVHRRRERRTQAGEGVAPLEAPQDGADEDAAPGDPDGADEDAASGDPGDAATTVPASPSPAPQRRTGAVAVLGALAVGLGLLTLVGAAHGERQAFPTRNVYEVRVLPYPDRVRWFADHGMPQADAFVGPGARQPYREPGMPPVVYVGDDDPELGEWLAWVEGDGRAALARYVLFHPGYVVGEPLRVPERTFNNARGDRGFYEAVDHPHVPLVDAVLARRTPEVLLVAALAGGVAIGRGRGSPAFLAGLVTATLAVPHGVVAWHSDGMETARHLVVPALQLHLGVLLMLVGLLPTARATGGRPGSDQVPSAHG